MHQRAGTDLRRGARGNSRPYRDSERYNPNRSEGPWGNATNVAWMAVLRRAGGSDSARTLRAGAESTNFRLGMRREGCPPFEGWGKPRFRRRDGLLRLALCGPQGRRRSRQQAWLGRQRPCYDQTGQARRFDNQPVGGGDFLVIR